MNFNSSNLFKYPYSMTEENKTKTKTKIYTAIISVIGIIISILYNLTRRSLPQKPVTLIPVTTSSFYLILSYFFKKENLMFNFKIVVLVIIFHFSKILYFLCQKEFNILEQTIFQQIKILIIVIGSVFYLKRRYRIYKYFGIVVIFSGMIISAILKFRTNESKPLYIYICSIISYILTAIGILYFDKYIRSDFYFWDYLNMFERVNIIFNLLFFIGECLFLKSKLKFKELFHYSVPIAIFECLPIVVFNYLIFDPILRTFVVQVIRIIATIVVACITRNELNIIDIISGIIILLGIIIYDFSGIFLNKIKKK
ncbi:hypothetical protein SLOPH_1036 [Spraguea lophii 42_110]|uniref:Uncharacterized protein n=1 Tax=Spraguea lophii (strain 42_110) TaxID=1358809 RepID=S7W7B5_SPRLO|nr:hypothetical protein SLOPH_1036 [Spraguea lophii 42_110]